MDAFSVVYIFMRYSHILREALTARFILKGIPEPLNVGRAGDTDSHALFFFTLIADEERTEAFDTL